MNLEPIILKTGNSIGHLVSAGFAVDAINNAVKGNYEIAAVEGVFSAYLQFSKYLDRKTKRVNKNILEEYS